LTTGDRIERPATIHLAHECVKGREYGRNSPIVLRSSDS